MKTANLCSKKILAGLVLFLCAALAAPQTAPAVTLTGQTRLTQTSPASDDRLGWRVAVTDDRMIAGAPRLGRSGYEEPDGSAVIFERGNDGTWSRKATLSPSNVLSIDWFGHRVAISGDRAIVGAYKAYRGSVNGNEKGAAYIFERSSTGTWSQVKEFNGEGQYDQFGSSVAISGDRAIVGAAHEGANQQGAAYVYERSSTGAWSQAAKLTASGRSWFDRGGTSVAISGGTAVVGAHRNNGHRGAAYIYERSSTGTWPQKTRLAASDAARYDYLGYSAAISSNGRLIVGAPQDDDGESNSGSAYVFERNSNGTWSQTAKLTASDGAANDKFGWSVSISGNGGAAIVGTETAGKAYVFKRNSNGTWSQTHISCGSNYFGRGVSISNNRAAIGEPLYDYSAARSNSGAAYVYNLGTGSGATSCAGQGDSQGGGQQPGQGGSQEGGQQPGQGGSQEGGQQPGQEDSQEGGQGGNQEGGQTGGTDAAPEPAGSDATHAFSSQPQKLSGSDTDYNDGLGRNISISGDRMIAGAPGVINSGSSPGYAYIYERSSSGAWSQVARLTASDGAARDLFGWSVAVSGDRAVVGAYQDDDRRGSAYIFDRSSSGTWSQTAKLTASDARTSQEFGQSVAIDGSRVVVGAHEHDLPGKIFAGAAYVFDRSSSGAWSQTAKLIASDGAAFDRFGKSVAVDGSRIIVGANSEDGTRRNLGAAYVFDRGSNGAWSQTAKLTASDGATNDEFGWSVAISGNRAVVGAYQDDANRGSAYIFDRGSNGAWSQTAKLTAGDEASRNAYFGWSVALMGGTAMVGTPMVGTAYGSGAVYVFTRSEDGTWSQARKLTPTADGERGTVGDSFGMGVSISSEGRAAVGSPYDYDGGPGAVYVYGTGTETGPAANPETPGGGENPGTTVGNPGTGGGTNPAPGDGEGGGGTAPAVDPEIEAAINEVLNNIDTAGSSVAISGDTAVIGSDGDDTNGHLSGTAYIMERNADGRWTQTQKLLPSDGKARGLFGRSVAVSGSRAVVGALGDDANGQLSGAVYVFDKSSSGTWSQTAKLTADDGSRADFLGRSVAVSGDVVIAGADGVDGEVRVAFGAAYVFERTGDGTWSQTAKLTASDELPNNANFGFSVSVSGSRAIVGTPRDNDDGADSGSAYIFERADDGAWSQVAKVKPGDGGSSHFFGESVSISGDRAVVGAETDDELGTGTGAAYIFERGSDGTWSQVQKLSEGDDAAVNNWFGESVSISGDRAVVGVNGADLAYVYKRDSEGAWSLEEELSPAAPANNYFGDSVAVSGNRVILISSIGTASIYEISSDTGDSGEEGPVARVSETVTLTGGSKLTASDGAANDWFGWSVAVSGSRAIVGASVNEVASRNSGAAYVFERSSNADATWSQTKLTASDGAFNDSFGFGVSISGSRAIVGAIGDNNATGAAYVFERSSNADATWSQTKLTASDGAASDLFGNSVSISGSRAIVGAPRDDDDGDSSGSAYVFERSSDGTWSQTKLTASDGAADDRFGVSVAVSGSRAIVGAYLDNDNGTRSGSAYVFDRNSAGTWSQTKLTPEDGAAQDLFGQGVSISGDIAVVGARRDDDNGSNSGAAYVFERSSNGTWSEVSKLTASDGAASDEFGQSVSVSGNRIIVGARLNDDGGENSGSAYVFERNSDGTWSETTKLVAEDGAAGDSFGYSVAISGTTAFIGAAGDDTGEGSAYVYEPSATTPAAPEEGSGSGPEPGTGSTGRAPVSTLSIAVPGQSEISSGGAGGCAISASAGSDGIASLLAALAPLALIPAFAGFRKRKKFNRN